VKPMNMLSASPIKILAGGKLNKRNEVSAPASEPQTKITTISLLKIPNRNRIKVDTRATLKERPSNMSRKLKAFVMSTIQNKETIIFKK